MSEKIVRVRIDSIYKYLQLFNGIIGLTETELQILAAFIEAQIKIRRKGMNMSPFSTSVKKAVAKRLGRDDYHTLNVYVKSLKDKGVIHKTDDGYFILENLIPNGEKKLTFIFEDGN